MSEDNAFWNYAVEIYSRPGVKELCLELQDSYQCSVNRLLFALWLAQQGRALADNLETPEIKRWRSERLEPLRRLRYLLKVDVVEDPALDKCYQMLKEAELEAEKVEIGMLQSCLHRCPLAAQQEGLGLRNLHRTVTGLPPEVSEKLKQLDNLAAGGSN